MRHVFLTATTVLLLTVPAWGAEEDRADEDPWIGKTRADVVQLLGKPQKVKCPTCHGTRFRRWIRAR